jgi:hypothetical protein
MYARSRKNNPLTPILFFTIIYTTSAITIITQRVARHPRRATANLCTTLRPPTPLTPGGGGRPFIILKTDYPLHVVVVVVVVTMFTRRKIYIFYSPRHYIIPSSLRARSCVYEYFSRASCVYHIVQDVSARRYYGTRVRAHDFGARLTVDTTPPDRITRWIAGDVAGRRWWVCGARKKTTRHRPRDLYLYAPVIIINNISFRRTRKRVVVRTRRWQLFTRITIIYYDIISDNILAHAVYTRYSVMCVYNIKSSPDDRPPQSAATGRTTSSRDGKRVGKNILYNYIYVPITSTRVLYVSPRTLRPSATSRAPPLVRPRREGIAVLFFMPLCIGRNLILTRQKSFGRLVVSELFVLVVLFSVFYFILFFLFSFLSRLVSETPRTRKDALNNRRAEPSAA